jgi:hypothetical protein
MISRLRAFLERAEFDVIEAQVRYCEGLASAEELVAATKRLRVLRTAATSPEWTKRELFAFRRYPQPPDVVAGH